MSMYCHVAFKGGNGPGNTVVLVCVVANKVGSTEFDLMECHLARYVVCESTGPSILFWMTSGVKLAILRLAVVVLRSTGKLTLWQVW